MGQTPPQRFPEDTAMHGTDGAVPARHGDFSLSPRAVALAGLAMLVGLLATGTALILLDLIGLITHLAYEGTLSTSLASPRIARLGPWSVLVPVVGGLIVGVLARFGSERIRGHGIPEAMQTILIGGSKMEPRLALLKPLSSAVSIGTGGPFGAEGPIIVTGGALGSIAGQLIDLSGAERRMLLVAGASAGMTAVFGTPVAAVLLAVEVLLFEWRPRSLLPVAAACASAAVAREALAKAGLVHALPLFPMPSPSLSSLSPSLAGAALLIGLAAGGLAFIATHGVYGAEDLFGRLRIHWMWWPALGGVLVGVGGLIEPRVLGVGYATIGAELAGRIALGGLLALLVCKLVVWAVALGSNTSGGVVAPVLLLGAALGGAIGVLLPHESPGTWALLGMAAALAGVMRAPLTSIVFAFELTHDGAAMPLLLIACASAYLLSVLVLKRSILTEKVARRGFHVFCEYEVDPLRAIDAGDALAVIGSERAVPVAAGSGEARADELLRDVANRMLSEGHTTMRVLDDAGAELGQLSRGDLLSVHERVLIEEHDRERPLAFAMRPRGRTRTKAAPPADEISTEESDASTAPDVTSTRRT